MIKQPSLDAMCGKQWPLTVRQRIHADHLLQGATPPVTHSHPVAHVLLGLRMLRKSRVMDSAGCVTGKMGQRLATQASHTRAYATGTEIWTGCKKRHTICCKQSSRNDTKHLQARTLVLSTSRKTFQRCLCVRRHGSRSHTCHTSSERGTGNTGFSSICNRDTGHQAPHLC